MKSTRKGQRRTRAQGEYAFDDRADRNYARLVFEPFTAAPDGRLELRICTGRGCQGPPARPRYQLQSDRGQKAGAQQAGVRIPVL